MQVMAMELEQIQHALKQNFGYTDFRPGQAEAIQCVLSGENALVVMPTGAGKSLCYQLPALMLDGVTLVISPLIALMKDQVDSLAKHGIAAAFINSSISPAEQRISLESLRANKYQLVYVAPERFRNADFMKALTYVDVALLAVDEAHCISQWGHDFRPDYLHIRHAAERMGKPPIIALTATATAEVQDDIVKQLGIFNAHRIITGFDRPNLSFEVRYARNEEAKLKELKRLLQEELSGTGIIYVGTRLNAEQLAEFVGGFLNISCQFYHAGMDDIDRKSTQEAFLADDFRIIIATNAFGMGVDKSNIRFVIHYDLPASVEACYQEIGRAGRDGQPARGILIYCPEDRALQEWFIENDAPTREELLKLFRVIRSSTHDGWAQISNSRIQAATGILEAKIRVGLSQLEQAGGIIRHPDEAGKLMLQLLLKDERRLSMSAAYAETERRRERKRRELETLITYAESNVCRREFILNYFGDIKESGDRYVRCCDNCDAPPSAPATDGAEPINQITTAILKCVQESKWDVGRGKLAKILKGSRAKDIMEFQYHRLESYGQLAFFTVNEIEQFIDQLIRAGYMKVIGGKYPVVHLTPAGEQALEQDASIEITLPTKTAPQAQAAHIDAPKSETVDTTYQLFQSGLMPFEIAAQRGLTINTIYSHIAELIQRGEISVDEIVPQNVQAQIQQAIQQASDAKLSTIKSLLPPDISYEEIRCVLASQQAQQATQTNQTPLEGISSEKPDSVQQFLSTSRAKLLRGNWDEGYALDFHSRYVGANSIRSEIGELTYQYKYNGQKKFADKLSEKLISFIRQHPTYSSADIILPIPSTLSNRVYDPVLLLAKKVSAHTHIELVPNALVKIRHTQQQKSMQNPVQKQANIAGAFSVKRPQVLNGKKILLLDDLYDSGATLKEATKVLKQAGAATVYTLTLTKTMSQG